MEKIILINVVYTLLKKYPSTEKITVLREKTLLSILNKTSKKHYKEEHALQLKSFVKFSVGIKDIPTFIHMLQLIELIEMLNSQIKLIEKEIDSYIDKESPILTISRINTVNRYYLSKKVQKKFHLKRILLVKIFINL